MTTPKRWQEIDRIFAAALEREPARRAAFLDEVCADDELLRQEVESLLAHDTPESLVGADAVQQATRLLKKKAGELTIKRIGRYQILKTLGAGGMGRVYLGLDEQLNRKVAIKLLSNYNASEAERMRRFVLEAQAAAALNHPNIAHIYEIGEDNGTKFIAMEFVDGETLRARMKAGAFSLEVALDIAIQLASALRAAHAAGIIHRDIKPENLMLRDDGLVKVLDFGIAKFTQAEGMDHIELMETMPGAIIGTAAYMSPEQARGALIDRRSDIWSVGVILYEMAARRIPFRGNTRADIISAVLERQPSPLSAESSTGFEALEQIVTRALNKDREARYQTAGELLTDLKRLKQNLESNGEQKASDSEGSYALAGGALDPPREPQTVSALGASTNEAETTAAPSAGYVVGRQKSYKYLVLVFLFILMVAAGFLGYRSLSSNNRAAPAMPFSEMSISRLTTSGKITHAAISPDGKYVAHVTVDADGQSLWVRQVAAPSSVRIAGPAPTWYVSVTFAPDGDSVYYLALDRDKGDSTLYRVPVLGGPSSMTAYDIGPIDFSRDGRQMAFVWPDRAVSRLIVASADGTNKRTLATRREPEFFRGTWNAPAWSPDGKTIACQVRLIDERGQYETVVGVSVADGSQTPLTSARWNHVGQPTWLADGSGLIVTASESATAPAQVWHIALRSGEVTRITNDLNDYHDLSLTRDSSRLTAVQVNNVSSIWVAPEGDANRAKQIASDSGLIQEMAWTPDERIVYRSNAGGSAEVWVMNADGSNPKQLTTGARASRGLTVSPDGRYIFFASDRAGRFNIWRVDAGGADLKQLTAGEGEFYPQSTPDGRWVVYQRGEVAEPRLWKVPVVGGEPVQVTETRAARPAVSPDGKLIAYHHLDPDAAKSRWRIGVVSSAGGRRLKWFDFPPTVTQKYVRWSPDGQSIAFVNSPGGLSDIWLQPLDGSPPKQLTDFKAEQILAFDWSRDGRSLALVRGGETSDVVLIGNTALK